VTLFLVLGFVGLGLVVLSLVVGDHLEAAFGGAFNALEGDVFSTAVIGGFLSAFGFGAAAADGAGLPDPAALAIGAGSGVVVGWFAWWLTRLVKDGPSDGTVSISDTVGQVGRVLRDIPGGESYGVIRVSVGGHVMQCNASSLLAIEAGSEVSVTGVLSPTAVTVAPVWNPQQG
jgi:membrane protein implicated in regulation of membrane protease activity